MIQPINVTQLRRDIERWNNPEYAEKQLAYTRYKHACFLCEDYGLPYTVIYDYVVRCENEPRLSELNACYPYPGYPKCDRPTYIYPDDCTGEVWDMKLNATRQAELDAQDKKYHLWDLITEDGKERWKYYFTHFLHGYDLDTFTEFDYVGTVGTLTEGEIDRLRDAYKRLQADYDSSPGKYYTEELRDDMDAYTRYRYRIEYTEDARERFNLEVSKRGYSLMLDKYEWKL